MITYPLLWAWAGCAATAAMVLIGCGLIALRPARRPAVHRAPIWRAARRSAYSTAYAARAIARVPGPRKAPESPTVPTGITIPPDPYSQHHTDEMTAVLGCTCSPILRGAPTVTEHAITTEYAISWTITNTDATTTDKQLMFDGPEAEAQAYDVAELLALTEVPWAMSTRTVDTAVTAAPWIAVARYAPLVHELDDAGTCTACEAGECPDPTVHHQTA